MGACRETIQAACASVGLSTAAFSLSPHPLLVYNGLLFTYLFIYLLDLM